MTGIYEDEMTMLNNVKSVGRYTDVLYDWSYRHAMIQGNN